jgi:GNAT superfamily N-acetyltransferase
MIQGYDIRPVPKSYLRRIVNLYIEHQEVAATEPGFMGWRVARQFSTYWDKKNNVLGCFDENNNLVGFIAWVFNQTDNPYEGTRFVEYDEEKKRYRPVTVCWHDQLLVVPMHRRKGLGTELMNTMLRMVNGNRVRNICHEEWLLDYYRSFGFETIHHGRTIQTDQDYWINERL